MELTRSRIGFWSDIKPEPARTKSVKLVRCACAHFEIGARHLSGRRLGRAFGHKPGLPATHERRIRSEGSASHARKSAHFIEQRSCEEVDLFAGGIGFVGQLETRSEQSARLV